MNIVTPTESSDTYRDGVSRRRNIAALRAQGIDPYPAAAFPYTHNISAARLDHAALIRDEAVIRLAGRITARRDLGGVTFLNLLQDGETLQLHLSERTLREDCRTLLDYLDLGDFVGVEGRLFHTRRGELTLNVASYLFLGKGVTAIPLGKRDAAGQVHDGLADAGSLLRERRHVHLMTDKRFRNRILVRDRIMRAIRTYFHSERFVEVETPTLSPFYGGAAATPFVTKSMALGRDRYLRVSPECDLKRLLCGDMQKVFEIGKNYRNEGIDASHNSEFTAMEWYEAYSDYKRQMERFQDLIAGLIFSLTGSYMINYKGRCLDFTPPWPQIKVLESVAEALGIPAETLALDHMIARWRELGRQGEAPASWGEAVMELFEALVEPAIAWGPVFVIDHPLEVSPLTKRHRHDPRLVERFEPFAGGMEIGNAYSELNDPDEQRRRLEEQDLARAEPYGVDQYFLSALDDGMPQAGGAGLGIDRLVMLLTDAERISDAILFPA